MHSAFIGSMIHRTQAKLEVAKSKTPDSERQAENSQILSDGTLLSTFLSWLTGIPGSLIFESRLQYETQRNSFDFSWPVEAPRNL